MKLFKSMVTIMVAICFMAATAFAAPEASTKGNTDNAQKIERDGKCEKHKWDKKKIEEFRKDPVKALNERKKELEQKYKDGKITKEKYDAINAKLDSRIKEINEFNKLGTAEKKKKLIDNLKTRLDTKVKEGKLTQEKANEIVKDYTEKIEKWDGKGYPKFFKKDFRKNK